MTEQMSFQNYGAEIKRTDVPQVAIERNAERLGGWVANTGPGVLRVFFGELVLLKPFRVVMLPAGYVGPVRIEGNYADRFQAVELTAGAVETDLATKH